LISSTKKGKYFWQGNEACVKAALDADCSFFAGYPITPASEIAEQLTKELPKKGGIAIIMEDEIASINSIIGASWTGAKVMTATSGPGFSLMQESIGYAFITETPCVIVDVQRLGPSTGQATKCGQGDVMQSRWGTHGDYSSIVFSPNSVQEMYELTIKAFNMAEKYRTPVILLADEIVAHMREQVSLSFEIDIIDRKKPKSKDETYFGVEEVPPMPAIGKGLNVVVTGSTHNEYGIRFTSDPVIHRNLVERINNKIERNRKDIIDVEKYNINDCSIGIVSYGCTSRTVYDVIELANQKGIKVGYVRPKTIWPFPEKEIHQLSVTAEKIIVPEMNLKQLFYEVERVACERAQVIPLNKIGGGELITPEELMEKIIEVNNK